MYGELTTPTKVIFIVYTWPIKLILLIILNNKHNGHFQGCELLCYLPSAASCVYVGTVVESVIAV